MNKESLKRAKTIIFNALYNSNINAKDRTELIFDENDFLNEENYDKNVKALRKIKYKKKK